MLAKYVFADLVRNPRRSLSTMVGVSLGVGLFCGVLFFIDGLSASMTQRAVAPLPIDMQRIISQRAGSAVQLTQTVQGSGSVAQGSTVSVKLMLTNPASLPANEVTLRSQPSPKFNFVVGSAKLDGKPIVGFDDNPLQHGPGRLGYNLGTLRPGMSRQLTYDLVAQSTAPVRNAADSSYSSLESVVPIAANQPPPVSVDELARRIAKVPGVASAQPLSIADLSSAAIWSKGRSVEGISKVFGFDDAYLRHDSTIRVVNGEFRGDAALLSVEAASALRVAVGDSVVVRLPDKSTMDVVVSGTVDLSRSRSLFSSRRGGDLETFIYVRNAIIVSSARFAERVYPAYERFATGEASGRLKNPPIREIDISTDRAVLNSDPARAVAQTRRIAHDVNKIAELQDYLLDNISNTLTVASADADVAKRLFVFLGLPGALLAAMLAAYAGSVLAEAQRREQAILRVRGASRRHLLRMLAGRTALLTATGSSIGLASGYVAARLILGADALARAGSSRLFASSLLGSLGGFGATGAALYFTGRRRIRQQIQEDRARMSVRVPLWRRARIDLVAALVVVVSTVLAVRSHAFDGVAGSVYFGRAVQLNLALLVLPVGVWIAGSLCAARVVGRGLSKLQPASSPEIGRPVSALLLRSVSRRPWAISTGVVISALIVALATSLAVFTSSYDVAKVNDARYANGADIRLTPNPVAERPYGVDDGRVFRLDNVQTVTPVIYDLSNVILRSARTSDPANLAAMRPAEYARVAPLDAQAKAMLNLLAKDPTKIALSRDMAAFLRAEVGDRLEVVLARATKQQVNTVFHIVVLYERLPGFPDGVDAVMSIDRHVREVPTKVPDFFLAKVKGADLGSLKRAVASLTAIPGHNVRVDSRATTLDRDQSSLAALNVSGLVDLDSGFALAMAVVAIVIFVFGLLLQRRREYITLRALGVEFRGIRALVIAEAGAVAIGGAVAGILTGATMAFYFVRILRPLFVLAPSYSIPLRALLPPAGLLLIATVAASLVGSRLLARMNPTELLRDE